MAPDCEIRNIAPINESIAVQEGRALFGADPGNYAAIRPPYPDAIWDLLRATGALRPGTATLEIGAGSGLATRRLLEFGVDPLTVVEPDRRFEPLLRSVAAEYSAKVDLRFEPFEDTALPCGGYDLTAAATSFHWIDAATGLARIADALRPGGIMALWWNLFGDPERHDAFHEATLPILGALSGTPSDPVGSVPYALDNEARMWEIIETGEFEPPDYQVSRWTLKLNTDEVARLYATFSPIARQTEAEQATILAQLMEVAEREFGGRVERNMVSPIYLARRNSRRKRLETI